jgi:hypothetical protein
MGCYVPPKQRELCAADAEHLALGGLMITRDKDFKTPTIGETVAVIRNYSAGRETIVRGGAVQVTDLPAMTVITIWKDNR